MGEHRADAAVDEAVHRPLGVLDAGDVVAPVDQRGHAGIDLRQRAHVIGDVVVLGLVARRQVGMDVLEIVRRHPFRADAAQRRFPSVHVGIDEAGHHDLVGGIDGLVGRGVEAAPGGRDGVAGDEQLTAFHLADLWIERDQPAALDENFLHGISCPCGGLTIRAAGVPEQVVHA